MFTGPLIVDGIFAAAGVVILTFGFKNLKFHNKINNLATSRIKALAPGDVEVKGKVVLNKAKTTDKKGKVIAADDKIVSLLKKENCVYYQFTAYKWVSGKHSRWVEICEKIESRPFYLRDETGDVLVDPKNAKLILDSIHSVEDDKLFHEVTRMMGDDPDAPKKKGFIAKIADALRANDRYKYEETMIVEGQEIYILGNAVENPNRNNVSEASRLLIAKSEKKDFIISNKKEKELSKSYFTKAVLLFLIGALLVFIGLVYMFNIFDWISFMGGFL